MKKNLIILIAGVITLTSCFSYAGAGAANGAYFGSVLGSAIGGITGGYHGHHVGTLVGMASGAIIGAAAGEAKERQVQNDRAQYLQEKARLKANRDARAGRGVATTTRQNTEDCKPYVFDDDVDSGFDENNGADDRIDIDFGAADEAPAADTPMTLPLTPKDYEQMEADGVDVPTIPAAMPMLEIRNLRFIDENGDNIISRGEKCEIVFEVFNSGAGKAFNVEPTVFEMTSNKHILVSPGILVESIDAHKGIRYTARVVADRMLKNGKVSFAVSVVKDGNPVAGTKVLKFDVNTAK